MKDTPGFFDDLVGGNKGYTARKEDVKEGKLFDFAIPLHVDFFHTCRIIPPFVKMKLKLTRSKDDFSILTNSGEELTVKIENLTLYVYRMQASKNFLQKQEKTLLKKNALYPISRTQCRKFTIPAGLSSASTPNIINGVLPRQIIIGMVRSDALNGSYTLNPFNFQNFDCSFLSLRKNGVQIPSRGYQPNFEKKLVRREVRALYDNIGVNTPADDTGCGINVEDFISGSTLFAFDLTNDLCNGYHYHDPISGTIDCEILFSRPLQHSISLICYMTFDTVVSLSKERSVTILP